MITGSDEDPFPNMLDPNTLIVTSLEGKQFDVVMSNSCIHIPPMHFEAGNVCEPQMLPVVEAEYVIVYDIVELLMASAIVALVDVYIN